MNTLSIHRRRALIWQSRASMLTTWRALALVLARLYWTPRLGPQSWKKCALLLVLPAPRFCRATPAHLIYLEPRAWTNASSLRAAGARSRLSGLQLHATATCMGVVLDNLSY